MTSRSGDQVGRCRFIIYCLQLSFSSRFTLFVHSKIDTALVSGNLVISSCYSRHGQTTTRGEIRPAGPFILARWHLHKL